MTKKKKTRKKEGAGLKRSQRTLRQLKSREENWEEKLHGGRRGGRQTRRQNAKKPPQLWGVHQKKTSEETEEREETYKREKSIEENRILRAVSRVRGEER